MRDVRDAYALWPVRNAYTHTPKINVLVTGKRVPKCGLCGTSYPFSDLLERERTADAAIGRMIREARPDLAADPKKLLALITPESAPLSPRRSRFTKE